MTTLKIEDSKARELYKKATPEFKQVLEDSFPKGFFSQKVTDRIKTIDDALEVIKITPNIGILLCYNGQDKDMIATQAHAKLTIIAKALNEGWAPDWNNGNEAKYYPYFNMQSGFGFSDTYYVYTYTYTCVGSRLCFKTRELAEYAGKEFESIYKDLLTL